MWRPWTSGDSGHGGHGKQWEPMTVSRIGFHELGDRGGHLGGTMKVTPWAGLCPGSLARVFWTPGSTGVWFVSRGRIKGPAAVIRSGDRMTGREEVFIEDRL